MSYNMGWRSVRAIGLCDYSNKLVPHAALRQQMEYNGSGLFNTGYLVAPGFMDKPNPQNLAFKFETDPVVIKNPRPDPQTFNESTPYLVYDVTGKTVINVISGATKQEREDQFLNFQACFGITLTGTAAQDITLVLPYTYFEIYIDIAFSGGFFVNLQLEDSSIALIVSNKSQLINSNTFSLSEVNF